MKILKIIFTVLSVGISIFIVFSIINSLISYKYEIEGRSGDLVNIQWVGEHLLNSIKWMIYFLIYVLFSIAYLLFVKTKK